MSRSRSRSSSRSYKKDTIKSMLDSIDHVFVINLEKAKDRKEKCLERLKLMGFPSHKIEIIKATDRSEESWKDALIEIGLIDKRDRSQINVLDLLSPKYQKKIKSSEKQSEKRKKEVLHYKAVIGTFFSHLRIWAKIGLMQPFKYCLILEDDMKPSSRWNGTTADRLFNKVPYVPLLLLGHCYSQPDFKHERPLETIEDIDNILVSWFTQCLHAYLVTTTFGLMIRGSYQQIFPISVPVDEWLPKFLLKNTIPFYIFEKQLINQDLDFESDIQITMDKDKDMFKD